MAVISQGEAEVIEHVYTVNIALARRWPQVL